MTEADILATTYEDSCAIFRPKLSTDKLRSTFVEEKIAEGVPCAITQGGGAAVSQSKHFAFANPAYSTAARTGFALHTRPGVDIQANDRLEVTHMGQTTTYYAGRPAAYISHKFIPLTLEKAEEVV